MDRRGLGDHPLEEDRGLREDLVPHIVVKDQDYLLSPSYGRYRDQHLPTVGEGAVDGVDEVHLHLLARRHDVLLVAVGGLGDQGLDSRVVPAGRVEKLRPAILVIAGVNDIVDPLADVQVHGRRA
jgi:hypothetical protein